MENNSMRKQNEYDRLAKMLDSEDRDVMDKMVKQLILDGMAEIIVKVQHYRDVQMAIHYDPEK